MMAQQQIPTHQDVQWCFNCGTLRMGAIFNPPLSAPDCDHLNLWRGVIKSSTALSSTSRKTLEINHTKKVNGNGNLLGGMSTGEACAHCGSDIIRDGGCGRCYNCGETGGCS